MIPGLFFDRALGLTQKKSYDDTLKIEEIQINNGQMTVMATTDRCEIYNANGKNKCHLEVRLLSGREDQFIIKENFFSLRLKSNAETRAIFQPVIDRADQQWRGLISKVKTRNMPRNSIRCSLLNESVFCTMNESNRNKVNIVIFNSVLELMGIKPEAFSFFN